jgi:hypothetical protein
MYGPLLRISSSSGQSGWNGLKVPLPAQTAKVIIVFVGALTAVADNNSAGPLTSTWHFFLFRQFFRQRAAFIQCKITEIQDIILME